MPNSSVSDHVIPLIPQSSEVPYSPLSNCDVVDTNITNVNTLITQPSRVPISQMLYMPEVAARVGFNSSKVICPSCRSTVYTRVERVATTKTHGFAMKLCLMMLCCPCAFCFPYCVDSCKASNHFCPSCDAFLGTYDH